METVVSTPHRGPFHIHSITRKILHKRGFGPEGIHEFLSWDLKKLPLLTQMEDMDKASERIVRAVSKEEKICIYGDYDVDGTSACALLYHFFQMLDTKVELMQPSRFVEGYGLHPESIEAVFKKDINLLVTVDCGMTDHKACDAAKEKGIDVIITDHHMDAQKAMPGAFAIINPNRRDEPEDSPLKVLAGVGVAFALCLRVKGLWEKKNSVSLPSLYPLLQFVAIGTICDQVKLTPVNLKLVRHGLKQMPTTEYPGVRAFFKPEERKAIISAEKLSFNVGPLINSKGRLEHPERALKLLVASDNHEASEHYSHLQFCNNERKYLQGGVFKEAREQIIREISPGHAISIAYHPDWHEGVIGIVASKLVEVFKVPAVVFTTSSDKGILKASARTTGQYNIFKALEQCKDLFVKFGGHKAAAGLSMPEGNLSLFKKRMEKILRQTPETERTVLDSYDLEISAGEIGPGLIKSLELLEPFGTGNLKPIFKMTDATLDSYDILKDIHVRWTFKARSSGKTVYHRGISFNYLTKWKIPRPEKFFEEKGKIAVYFTLGFNLFGGREFVQLNVQRVETM